MDSISSELTDRLVSQSQRTLITWWALLANHIPREAGLSDNPPIDGQDGLGKLLLWISMAKKQGLPFLMEEGGKKQEKEIRLKKKKEEI